MSFTNPRPCGSKIGVMRQVAVRRRTSRESSVSSSRAVILFKCFMVPLSCVEVRIGVPIPFPAPESGASAGLGALPNAVQRCGEVDAGEDAEVFGFAVVPIFEQPLGVILGSRNYAPAVLVGEYPRLFERVAFIHGVHPVEGGSSDYEVGGCGGHGVLLWCSVRRESILYLCTKIVKIKFDFCTKRIQNLIT